MSTLENQANFSKNAIVLAAGNNSIIVSFLDKNVVCTVLNSTSNKDNDP